jgi:hypothetical protein
MPTGLLRRRKGHKQKVWGSGGRRASLKILHSGAETILPITEKQVFPKLLVLLAEKIPHNTAFGDRENDQGRQDEYDRHLGQF